MDPVVIRPHARPRDARDAFIGVVVTLLIAAALYLVGYAAADIFRGPRTAAIVGFVAVVLAFAWIALRTVRGVELDDSGIRFLRFAGRPRFISWDHLQAVRRADRAEVVLHGWLLPPLAMRACSASLTSLGHYRFDAPAGSVYFPPADEVGLLSALERNWGDVIQLTSRGSAGSRPG